MTGVRHDNCYYTEHVTIRKLMQRLRVTENKRYHQCSSLNNNNRGLFSNGCNTLPCKYLQPNTMLEKTSTRRKFECRMHCARVDLIQIEQIERVKWPVTKEKKNILELD